MCVPSLQPLTLSVRRRSSAERLLTKPDLPADDNAAAAAVVVVNKAGMIFADDAAEFDIAESAADRCLFKLNGNREIVFRKQLDVGWQSENASLEQTRFTGLHIAYINRINVNSRSVNGFKRKLDFVDNVLRSNDAEHGRFDRVACFVVIVPAGGFNERLQNDIVLGFDIHANDNGRERADNGGSRRNFGPLESMRVSSNASFTLSVRPSRLSTQFARTILLIELRGPVMSMLVAAS